MRSNYTQTKLRLDMALDTADIITGERLAAIADFAIVTTDSLVVPYVRKHPERVLVVDHLPLRVSHPTRQRIHAAKVLFLKTDLVPLLPMFHSFLRDGVTIITHDSDYGVTTYPVPPEKQMQPATVFDISRYLESPKIVAWYAVNCQSAHPKLHPIPLGISNSQYPHGDLQVLHSVRCHTIPRNVSCYANFSCHTNPEERNRAKETLSQNGFAVTDTSTDGARRPYDEFLQQLRKSKTVACPTGNGTDSHRVWESLYLGAVPIVSRHPMWEHFRGLGLPILIVDDFSVVTKSWISRALDALTNSPLLSRRSLDVRQWERCLRAQ